MRSNPFGITFDCLFNPQYYGTTQQPPEFIEWQTVFGGEVGGPVNQLKMKEEKMKRSMKRIFNEKDEEKGVSTLKLECPGVSKDSLSLTRTGCLVTIKDTTGVYGDYIAEFNSDRHDLKKISASYNAGVLTLTTPLLKPVQITIE